MRIGMNIDGNRIRDPQHLYDFMGKLRPKAVTVISNGAVEDKIWEVTEGKTTIIGRGWGENENVAWNNVSPKDYAEGLIGAGRKHIWRYVLNEPYTIDQNLIKKMLTWGIEVAQRCADGGVKTVMMNFPPGYPDTWHIDTGLFDNFLFEIGKLSQAGMSKLGYHEYTGILAPYGVGYWDKWDLLSADKVQPDRWPKKEELPIARVGSSLPGYWHLLRCTWGLIRAKEIGAAEHEIFITENFLDRMPDMTVGQNHIFDALTKRYGLPQGYLNMRGPYTLTNVWKYYFPTWSASKVIFEQLKWIDSIYPKQIIGFTPFIWGSGNEWEREGFDFSYDTDLHNMLVAYANESPKDTTVPTIPSEPPVVIPTTPAKTVDMLEYLRGDGRIYVNHYEWAGGGEETVQTQTEGRRFFNVKNGKWEELWYDNEFIYRGTDISPSPEELYQLSTSKGYGSPWIKRQMTEGDFFFGKDTVTFRWKSDGQPVPNKPPYDFPHWVQFKKYHSSLTFKNGTKLADVVELWGFTDNNGKPANEPFEKYFYAKAYGLVGWFGSGVGEAYFGHIVVGQSMPRQQINWLKLPDLPALEPETPANNGGLDIRDSRWQDAFASSTTTMSNVRQLPDTKYSVVGRIAKDTPVRLLLQESVDKPDGRWIPVRLNANPTANHQNGDFSNLGWCRQDVFTYKLVEPPPELARKQLSIVIKYANKDSKQLAVVNLLKQTVDFLKQLGSEVAVEEVDAT